MTWQTYLNHITTMYTCWWSLTGADVSYLVVTPILLTRVLMRDAFYNTCCNCHWAVLLCIVHHHSCVLASPNGRDDGTLWMLCNPHSLYCIRHEHATISLLFATSVNGTSSARQPRPCQGGLPPSSTWSRDWIILVIEQHSPHRYALTLLLLLLLLLLLSLLLLLLLFN